MDILRSLATKLLPVLIALGLGVAIRRGRLLDEAGVAALKRVVTRVTLPFVIFQAFYSADYSAHALVSALMVLLICLALFGLGFLLQRPLRRLTGLLPFTLAGFEMGMLGFPLFLLLAGQEHMGAMAVADLGQEVFVFTIYLFLLGRHTGARRPLGEELGDIIKNPVIIALLLGLLAGASGLTGALAGSLAEETLHAVSGFVSAPTAVLILLSIGYDLRLERGVLGRAALVVLLRLVAVAGVGGGLTLLLFRLVPYSPPLLLALLMMFCLPAPFALPVYSRSGQEARFVAMFLSLGTLLFVGLFALLLAIAPGLLG
ncbi:MAG: hypothetical protein GXY84_05215 [Clostridiales bacterium]|nr:hypothetical protein [Clostridiales bacterium]